MPNDIKSAGFTGQRDATTANAVRVARAGDATYSGHEKRRSTAGAGQSKGVRPARQSSHHSSASDGFACSGNTAARGAEHADTAVQDNPAKRRPEHVVAKAAVPVHCFESGTSPLYAGCGRVCVVYVTNGNSDDLARLVWSLRSLVRVSSSQFDVVIISNDEIRDGTVLSSCGWHAFRNITDMYDTLHGAGMFRDRWNRRWPFEVLYRLGIPLNSYFSGYSRVLYLDTDTLVLSGKVDRLLNADLSGFEAGGVYDIDGDCYARIDNILSSVLPRSSAVEVIADIGPSLFTHAYVNAGVLLMNLDEIRKRLDWYRRRLRMFWDAECRGQFEYLDQDFVNSMMRVKTDFNTMFNWQRGGYPRDCIIRHYIKDQKPDMRARAEKDGLI